MLAVALAAPFLGVDNFAVSAALGLAGVRWRLRLQVAMVFGGLAALAIVVGALGGTAFESWLGPVAQYAGGIVLAGLGLYQLWPRAGQATPAPRGRLSLWSLALLGAGVSLDTVVAGVAFGLRGDPILASATVVGAVTALMSVAGLETGGVAGSWLGRLSHRATPAVALVLVGVGIGTGVLP